MRGARVLVVALVAALVLPGAAMAGTTYPPAGSPGKGEGKRKGKGETLRVCKKGCRFKTISRALRYADGADTIRVKRGVYRESVYLSGPRYDGLKIIGDPRRPRRVRLEGKGLKGRRAQNAIFIYGSDRVRVDGFHARNYKANGFFVANANGYTFTNLIAEKTGVYGIYAFNCKGGTMSRSEAFHVNDGAFYVGQTPPQTRPKRTIVKNVKGYESAIGFTGTNMRYVTIKNSSWFNNGVGIVPNALSSERFPPPEKNVISNNRVFWNNFNYYRGAPFRIPDSGPGGLNGFPIGIGILLFGSQDTVVERNKVFGNWLSGFGAVKQVLLADETSPRLKEAAELRNNVVRNNDFGLGGRDLNGRDLFYDGSGTRNCFANNRLRSPNLPAGNSTFSSCPGPARNAFDEAAQATAIAWVTEGAKSNPQTFEKYWVRKPHAAQKGVKPVERWRK